MLLYIMYYTSLHIMNSLYEFTLMMFFGDFQHQWIVTFIISVLSAHWKSEKSG